MKAVLPHAVADYSYRKRSRLVSAFLGQEASAKNGFDLEQIKIIGGNKFGPGAFRVLLPAHTQWSKPANGHIGNQLQVVPIVAIVLIGRGHQMFAAEGYGLDQR